MPWQSGEQTAGNHRRRLTALVVIHVSVTALGLLLRRVGPNWTGDEPLMAMFGGLTLCQMALLGIWVGWGRNPLWLRGVGSLGGLVGLWLAICAANIFLWEYAIFVAAPTVTVAVLLFCGRWMAWALRRDSCVTPSRSEFQFGIRHVMLFTLAVAVILAIGRWRGWPHFKLLPELWQVMRIFTPAFALLTLISIWATLGQPRWLVRGGVTVIAGLAVGWGLDRSIDAPIWFYTVAMPTMTISLCASLLVVRSCGYRLVRVRRTQDPSTQALPPN